MSEETQEQQETAEGKKQFPCKDCGAKLSFAPGASALKCPYCGCETTIPQSEEDIQELDFEAALRKQDEPDETVENEVVKCKSCAAESTLDPNVTASECPFCGSDLVTPEGSKKTLKPRSLLPFKITKKQAGISFKNWLNSLWFAPGALKKYAEAEGRLNGMYVPYWTYDCDATTFYRGERGDDYWETETYTTTEDGERVTKTREVRKTRWHSVSGTVWNSFDDVLVLASHSLPRKYTEALEPWDLQNLVPYSDEYLSGFRAESYQVDLEQGFGQAKEMVAGEIRDTIEDDIGGDHQRIHAMRSRYDNITFKHILLPVWISAYRYQNKAYRFLVNARTGEVQGERPWSWIKIGLAVLAGLVAAGVIVYFAMQS